MYQVIPTVQFLKRWQKLKAGRDDELVLIIEHALRELKAYPYNSVEADDSQPDGYRMKRCVGSDDFDTGWRIIFDVQGDNIIVRDLVQVPRF